MNKPIAHIVTKLIFILNNLKTEKVDFNLNAIDSVLFIETSKMGDVVSMLPLLQSFNDFKPNAKLIAAVDSQYSDILKGIPFITSIVPLEGTKSFRGFQKAKKILKQLKVSLTVSVSPSYRNALLTLFSNSKYKIGYFESKTSTTPQLYETTISEIGFKSKIPQKYFLENITERSLKIARVLSIPVNSNYPVYSIPIAWYDETKLVLTEYGIKDSSYVVIHPFSGWDFKSWDLNRFLSLAERISERGITVIIIGDSVEQMKISSLTNFSNNKIHFIFCKPLNVIIGIIKKAKLFIGNDSGPLHLATMLGVPCVGIFGPANPNLTAPISQKNIYLFKKVDCSPCNHTRCLKPQDPCINLISLEEVAETAFKLLNENKYA